MKRFGCHVLVLPNGEVLRMQVVELSDVGSVVNYYTLMEEQAATEWALNYMRDNKAEVAAFWKKLSKAIKRVYRLNKVS
jgi:hypothetical protein